MSRNELIIATEYVFAHLNHITANLTEPNLVNIYKTIIPAKIHLIDSSSCRFYTSLHAQHVFYRRTSVKLLYCVTFNKIIKWEKMVQYFEDLGYIVH